MTLAMKNLVFLLMMVTSPESTQNFTVYFLNQEFERGDTGVFLKIELDQFVVDGIIYDHFGCFDELFTYRNKGDKFKIVGRFVKHKGKIKIEILSIVGKVHE